MRILLRADAGGSRGAGHAMRMLTLGVELADQGHDAVLMGDLGGVGWLEARLAAGGVPVLPAAPDALDPVAVRAARPDRVVVDSYLVDAAAVSAVAREVPLLAVTDGDPRGISAGLYLDPNLGAVAADRTLAGSRYALVRREFLNLRRATPVPVGDPPRIVVFLGGTDATGAIGAIVASIAAAVPSADIVPVTSADLPGALAPTAGLPGLLADADLIVCAAGTSAWDVSTLGVPAILVAVVGNQRPGLAAALEAGIAGGVDASADPGALGRVGAEAARVLSDDALRTGRVTRAVQQFDGLGARRVAEALLALGSEVEDR